jgi:hypothetical protein
MLTRPLLLTFSQEVFSRSSNQPQSNPSTFTPKQTLEPISFVSIALPTATRSAAPATEYLKSTGMIILYCGIGLLLVLLAIVAIIWKRTQVVYAQEEINDGLVESLVDDANLPKEGTIEL